MSKIKKDTAKTTNSKSKQIVEKSAVRSVMISAIIGGFLFFISIIFNGEIITLFPTDEIGFLIIDMIIKAVIILLFFIFMLISVGNYKELTGKPVSFKEIVLLFFLSLIQAFKNPWVFLLTFIGLIMLIIYFYLIQEV